MRYGTLTKRIDEALKAYTDSVDASARKFEHEKRAFEETCEQMKAKYLPDAIEEFKREKAPAAAKYRPELQRARAKASAICDFNLESMRRKLDTYFNAPIAPDFATKINAVSVTGLSLTNAEFELLERSARTYTERRLLNHLAESRTQKAQGVELAADGTTRATETQEPNPYRGIDLPNIENAYKAYREYETSVKACLEHYAGENAELVDALEQDQFGVQNHAPEISVAFGTSYFRNDAAKKLNEAISGLSDEKEKRELTERERKLIDAVIDLEEAKKFPQLTPRKVRKIAEENEDLAELFRLDNRYSCYLPTEEE